MRHLLILPALFLAACAPTAQVDPVITASRTYAAACPAVLDALSAAAIRIRPPGLSWQPFTVQGRTDAGVTLLSRGAAQIGATVTVLASCEGAATLTLASSGQGRLYAEPLNAALLDSVKLP